eukprot:Em0005g396a
MEHTPPAAPQITVSTASSDQFTLVLEPSSNATSYNVSVNDSVPISISVANYNVTPTNYNVSIGNSSIMLMSIPSNGGLSYMLNFSNLMNNTDYTVSVVAINCAGSSSPAIAKLPGRLSDITILPSSSSSVPSGSVAVIGGILLVNLAAILLM